MNVVASVAPDESTPPATNNLPSPSSVAVWNERLASASGPDDDHACVDGVNHCRLEFAPPISSTVPSCKRVAVCPAAGTGKAFVAANLPRCADGQTVKSGGDVLSSGQ